MPISINSFSCNSMIFEKGLNVVSFDATKPASDYSNLKFTNTFIENLDLNEYYQMTENVVKDGWNHFVIGTGGDQYNGDAWDFWNSVPSSIMNNLQFVIFSADTNGDIYKLSEDLSTNKGKFGNGNSFSGHGENLAFGFDGYLYAADSGANSLLKIDPSTMSEVNSFDNLNNPQSCAYSPEGFVFATEMNADYDLVKINPDNMNEDDRFTGVSASIFLVRYYKGSLVIGLYDFDFPSIRKINHDTMSENDGYDVGTPQYAIAASAGKLFVSRGDFGFVHRAVYSSLSEEDALSITNGLVNCLCFGPDGNLFTGNKFNPDSQSTTNEIAKFNPDDFSRLDDIDTGDNGIYSLCYAPNGMIYFGSNNNTTGSVNPNDMTSIANQFTGHSSSARGGVVYALDVWSN